VNINYRLPMGFGFHTGDSLLHNAVRWPVRSRAARYLLARQDVDPNIQVLEGQTFTPLHILCGIHHNDGRVPHQKSVALIRTLLEDPRTNVNMRDVRGCTPLFFAAGRNPDAVKLLIGLRGKELQVSIKGYWDYAPLAEQERYELTDASEIARRTGHFDSQFLLWRFIYCPISTSHIARVLSGIREAVAADVFALVMFVCDGLLRVRAPTPVRTRGQKRSGAKSGEDREASSDRAPVDRV
jgi:hypothetical protein